MLVYVYSLFIFAALFFGLFVIWKRGNELHFEAKELFDGIFEAAVWTFIAARIGYVVTQFPSFGLNILEWFNVVGRPGWYFPAGLIGGWLALRRIAKKMKADVYQLADLLVIGVALTQGILAIGAFVAGVGYGAPTTWFIGIQFAGVYDKRFPVQLWDAVVFLGSFWYLWWAEGVYRTFSWYKGNKSQAATGFLTGMYLMLWGLGTFVGTLFRTPQIVVAGVVRMDLVIAMAVALVGGWVLLRRSGLVSGGIWRGVLDYFGLV
jgi:phosphatidylglycerol---prolipoprotein diacylglyceryl transferase